MNIYKSKILLVLIIPALFATWGCKKFLNVNPVTAMSGNNFWKSKSDVEQFTTGAYFLLRKYTVMDGHTMLAMADYRSTPWRLVTSNTSNNYVPLLNSNNIRGLLTAAQSWSGSYNSFVPGSDQWGFDNMSDWGFLFQVVATANTILADINNSGITDMTAEDKKYYEAEAVFIRSITYFLMVRHWGDVPYITSANTINTKGRTDQITVLKNCIKDLQSILNDLPWTYTDISKRGARAMKGGALILMMEMYMWLAGFDESNQMSYYQETVKLGDILTGEGAAYYHLLDMEEYQTIFIGNSPESLFEIGQDGNSGEYFGRYATVAELSLRTPYKPNVSASTLVYNKLYLEQLYDPLTNGENDKRKVLWFEQDYMYDETGQFVFKKFINFLGAPNGNPSDSKIIFRYVDAYLLKAEAQEKLDDFAGAIESINVVRRRAGATEFVGGEYVSNMNGISLEDAIWWERERELMGESSLFYDLVRTKKIMSTQYTPNTINYTDFLNGAWTYPIRNNVIERNPAIRPNPYWL